MEIITKQTCLTFLAFFLLCSMSPAMAAKPESVIEFSNGYPSGPHYNLNIHGKSDFACNSKEGGNSVFINEYGDSTITYVTNKRSTVSELVALDKCAEDFDGDPVKVQLPYEPKGYYVFATTKAKPNNGHHSEESSVILSQNLVREACNATEETADSDFPNYTECPDDTLLALGLIVGENLYVATDVGFVRFDGQNVKGKGKSKAVDITNLFMWTGWFYDPSLDANGDGVINESDVPSDYDLDINGGNENETIDSNEFNNWIAYQESIGMASYYENEWILNVAELVSTDQPISNDGIKLLKVRFYPVETTEYTSPYE